MADERSPPQKFDRVILTTDEAPPTPQNESRPAPGPERIDEEWSQALARELDSQDVHPVLIIGTGGSGKTTLLQSLLGYAQSTDEAGFVPSFGDSIFPANYPGKHQRDLNALNFYDNSLEAFRHKKLAARTQLTEGPFFVPVSISAQGLHRPLRFAFLESMGEWFERQGEGGDPSLRATAPYRNLRWEITSILQVYEKPVSVIFLAPVVGMEGQSREYSHECLANAMRQYDQVREAKSLDNALLLASKWDAKCSPDDPNGGFSDATAHRAVDLIQDGVVWPRFCSISGLRKGAKAFSPYSAARISKSGVMTIGGPYADVIEQFNRTVWNWLYGNACEERFSVRKRPVLFPDVVPKTNVRLPLYQRLCGFFLPHRGSADGERPA